VYRNTNEKKGRSANSGYTLLRILW